jgi:hypothetical protein
MTGFNDNMDITFVPLQKLGRRFLSKKAKYVIIRKQSNRLMEVNLKVLQGTTALKNYRFLLKQLRQQSHTKQLGNHKHMITE